MADLVKVFKNLSIILILSSCSYFSKQSADNNRPHIRIVDLNGKPHQVKTRVPELNAEIISKIHQNNNFVSNTPQLRNQKIADNVAPQNPGQYNKVTTANKISPATELEKSEPEKFDGSGYAVQNTNQDKSVDLGGADNLADDDKQGRNIDYKDFDNQQTALNTELNSRQSLNQSQNNVLLNEPKENNSKSFKFSGSKISAGNNNFNSNIAPRINTTHGIFVQTGLFSSADNANQNLKRVSAFYKAMIEESVAGDKKSYRVLIGPFSNKKQAQIMIKKLSKSGQKSFLVEK
jgi:cell division septation protein DedD